MGRVKLKIKRLENTNGRQATYAKRKQGIIKKASELSILCDIDIVLLMFSPTGKPSLCRGKRSSIEELIGKFSQLTPQERTKRKLESLEVLKKTFRRLDHDVNIHEFLGTSNPNIEELSSQVKLLQSKLFETQKRISCWTEPDKINSIEHLGQMENSLQESLNKIRMMKENIQNQQLMSLECNSPFNDIQMPFRMCSGQQLQSFPWINNNDNTHIVVAEDPKMLINRDVECSTSSSYGSFASYIGTGKSPEISTSPQENGLLNEFNQTAPLRLQLGGQLPYLPYNLNLFNDIKIEPAADMIRMETPLNYHLAGSFEAHQAGCSNNYHSWAPTAAQCPIPIFDEDFYAQIPD